MHFCVSYHFVYTWSRVKSLGLGLGLDKKVLFTSLAKSEWLLLSIAQVSQSVLTKTTGPPKMVTSRIQWYASTGIQAVCEWVDDMMLASCCDVIDNNNVSNMFWSR